ncbi:hypothetical protein ACF1BU_18430 [Streptomyces sp. NPDC014724]|uniref:hypothetical protein n=1 Tax=unclassified Streptomyces TaxID=2593676 RepID=UPI0036F7D876
MATDGITTGKKYYLVHDNRGVGFEGNWLRLSKTDGDNWHPVIFHDHQGTDYVIEHTEASSKDNAYWTWDSKGVLLKSYDDATLWHTLPTENGIMLYGKYRRLVHAPKSSKRWLETESWPELLQKFNSADRSVAVDRTKLEEDPTKTARFEFKLIPA